ncbi:MAG: extracellular solute-binding protein [Actinophytocola sp.]|nr:extracellular solute-binding protein [Actinophytocola sp.]
MNAFKAGLVVASAAALLAACGGGPPTEGGGAAGEPNAKTADYSQWLELTGKERHDVLVTAAEKEGKLSLYTSLSAEVVDELADAWEETYEDIDLEIYRASGEEVLPRILQENAAGYGGADVVETNATEMEVLGNKGLLQPYQGDALQRVPAEGKFGTWTATRFNVFAPSWNTDIVKQGDEPKTWEDLADPAYKGKLALEIDDYDWYMGLHDYWRAEGKSEEEIDKLFQAMAANAKKVKGHSVMAEMTSSGQFGVAASNYTYIVEELKADGAPIELEPLVSPVILRPNGAGLMKTAQHPAAALLFKDWLLDDGQQVLQELNMTPSTDLEGDLGGTDHVMLDVEKVVAENEKWSKGYEQLLSGSAGTN